MNGDFIDEVFDPDDANLEEKEELSQLIDRRLSAVRPERYDVGDKDWMHSVIQEVIDELADLPMDEMIHETARRRVHGREKQATRQANSFLRQIAQTGQPPLGWPDGGEGSEGNEWKALLSGLLRLPISIGKHRVRLGAASPADLEEWILTRDEQQDKELAARELTRNGGALFLGWMREQGVLRVEDLRFKPDPPNAA